MYREVPCTLHLVFPNGSTLHYEMNCTSVQHHKLIDMVRTACSDFAGVTIVCVRARVQFYAI